jgi:hypothetical protein
MVPLYTGASHRVDIYYQWATPTNVPPTVDTWHGYWDYFDTNQSLSVSAYFSDWGDGIKSGWWVDPGEETTAEIVFGNQVEGGSPLPELEIESFIGMLDEYASRFPSGPAENQVGIVGREIISEFAAVWWDGEDGFKWK